METRKIYKCFISSPGDCKNEREACQKAIDKINIGLAKHLGVNFETFMWEYDVLPDMGKNGQEIIDEYIVKSKYDIFIGIMKNRFGHPTKKAGSGTEHEFNDALERKLEDDNSIPRIIFFFGKELIDPDNFDPEQYQKVKEFKRKIGDEGLYIAFDGITNFENLLEKKIELFIKENSAISQPEKRIEEIDLIAKKMQDDLDESLKSYNEAIPVWIDPIISSKREVPKDPTKNHEFKVDLKGIINNPNNYIIKAPSEFGLTSLAHFIKLEAWKNGKTFLYIDAKRTKKHKIVRDIYSTLENYYFTKDVNKIDCILLDSVCLEENGIMQMVKNICDSFTEIPLIILNTIDNNFFLKSDEDDKVEIKRKFTSYYLLPLPQTEVRKLVKSYTFIKCIEEDEESMLSMVTKDLETLNMHRTAKNCISILRASSKIGTGYSPINRTKLLDTLLSIVFEEYEIPTYKDKKPDIKDCTFVLGYFCELLTIQNDFEFTEDFFMSNLRDFCAKNYIELDLNYLFNALVDNSIFGRIGVNNFYFKNSYWVFYFLAHHMNLNKEFLDNVYENSRYIDFPEIIEFYTGIDRNKSDALVMLIEDIEETLKLVRNKVKIDDNINPYKSISWNPDVSVLEKEQEKISKNVISSGFPDEVKDKYDDKHYDQIRPYNQVISSVLREFSYQVLMRQISAASRALRNSDFVNPELKKQMLDKIVQSWNEINKMLIVLSPILADKGKIAFQGASFFLNEDDFNITDPNEKRLAVLLAIPSNIVRLFKDDLFSNKMAPLICDKAVNETNSLIKHELMILILAERPKNWNKLIDNYIISLDKNSFFLSDVLITLEFQYNYKTTEIDQRRIIDLLMQKCRAKHIFKSNNPDLGLINRLRQLDKK
ncbi:DUF4062 domain-containing protein [Flavobacterium sp. LB2P53]|uniref:DUF4062 domain-containing protein n=1 Tax=Flavobacterium sp. LB2P53 TaxID=2497481 RepID=UPI000F82480B|nr:DUF4062 domain-containing protein [Flavobacterium sp. LB2P53]RTY67680.1 DUF4062 domain-containing protein [Flavobacterium sp. LB2P53]